ncbi:MAG: SDR family NAD(P)-dependent oxidoreductase, partial [Candidatus Thiodiazotropha sp.]
MKLEDKRIVLTGAGGGIGAHVARLLAEKGARLVLLDRSEAALEETAGMLREAVHEPLIVPVDLLDAQSRGTALEQAISHLGGVDILINNAGLMSFRPFHQEDPEVINRIVQLNTLVPMQLTRQLLPRMLDQGMGLIVNVGSTFGSIAFAWFAAY